jgi:hypothetical protein
MASIHQAVEDTAAAGRGAAACRLSGTFVVVMDVLPLPVVSVYVIQ